MASPAAFLEIGRIPVQMCTCIISNSPDVKNPANWSRPLPFLAASAAVFGLGVGDSIMDYRVKEKVAMLDVR